MVGLGIHPDGWTGIESVASLRLSLEIDGSVAAAPTDGTDLAAQLNTLRATITAERRRRAVSRAIMRDIARDAAQLERIERVARLFAFIHMGLNGLELFLGSLQGLGALTAVLALIGMRVRMACFIYLYIIWLVVDLGVDVSTDILALNQTADPARAEARLRGVIVSVVVQVILVVSTLYIMVRYLMALRKISQPRPTVEEVLAARDDTNPADAAPNGGPQEAGAATGAPTAGGAGAGGFAGPAAIVAAPEPVPAPQPGIPLGTLSAPPTRRTLRSGSSRRSRRLESHHDGLWADTPSPPTRAPRPSHRQAAAASPPASRDGDAGVGRSYPVFMVPAGSRRHVAAAAAAAAAGSSSGGDSRGYASSSWQAHRQTLRSTRSTRALRRMREEQAALVTAADAAARREAAASL
jgi:hypothetical protein